jgi:CO/xanthine dehydrogenase FAD-binding subunit
MDLNSVSEVLLPRVRTEIPAWSPSTAWVAGGSWIFSEPQPWIDRLVDLGQFDWTPLEADASGLRIAATCTFAQLRAWRPPSDWRAADLIDPCCRALSGSFKIWKVATIGGNVCLALPAGPMIALACALEATCVLWRVDGGERRVDASQFILGPQRTALAAGELLRALEAPASSLRRLAAVRRASLSPSGRSASLLIGTLDRSGAFALTVTGATPRPCRLAFADLPDADLLAGVVLREIAVTGCLDDVHGRADWRRAVTLHLSEEIRAELAQRARS